MLGTYRYARGRRGWLEAREGQREGRQLLPQGTRGSPDAQDTDALSSPELTGRCPKEVSPVGSPVGEVLAQHRGTTRRVLGATPKDRLTRVCDGQGGGRARPAMNYSRRENHNPD